MRGRALKDVLDQHDLRDVGGAAIRVADFGAVPGDGKSDTAAIRKAIEACRAKAGAQLVFAKGRYDLRGPRGPYLRLKGVDYKAALDSIRNSLSDGISRSDFGYQLTKFIALFGDGHSRVASSTVRLVSLCSGYLPFLVEESSKRILELGKSMSELQDILKALTRHVSGPPWAR